MIPPNFYSLMKKRTPFLYIRAQQKVLMQSQDASPIIDLVPLYEVKLKFPSIYRAILPCYAKAFCYVSGCGADALGPHTHMDVVRSLLDRLHTL
jgi:hypothetical protein